MNTKDEKTKKISINMVIWHNSSTYDKVLVINSNFFPDVFTMMSIKFKKIVLSSIN